MFFISRFRKNFNNQIKSLNKFIIKIIKGNFNFFHVYLITFQYCDRFYRFSFNF